MLKTRFEDAGFCPSVLYLRCPASCVLLLALSPSIDCNVIDPLESSKSPVQMTRRFTCRNCVAILTGHSHYVMSALFYLKEDIVVSALCIYGSDRPDIIFGLPKSAPNSAPGSFDTFDNFSTVKYVLEDHDRRVNYAVFHPTS